MALSPELRPSPPDPPRSLPTPFLTKTYHLVDDPIVDDLISWTADGSAFVVWRPVEFARDLLPKHFKHCNFSSFVRQLNTYGFRKTVPDRWEFAHDSFKRGEKRLLSDIHRRKNAAPSVPASPEPAEDLAVENERLRRENESLGRELSKMRSLCDNIAALVSSCSGVGAPPSSAALELMPMRSSSRSSSEGSGESAKLFGVHLGGVKRLRVDEREPLDGGAEEHRVVMRREPLDHRIADGDECSSPSRRSF